MPCKRTTTPTRTPTADDDACCSRDVTLAAKVSLCPWERKPPGYPRVLLYRTTHAPVHRIKQ